MQVNASVTFGLLEAQVVPKDFGSLPGGKGRYSVISDCSLGVRAGSGVLSGQLPVIYPINVPD